MWLEMTSYWCHLPKPMEIMGKYGPWRSQAKYISLEKLWWVLSKNLVLFNLSHYVKSYVHLCQLHQTTHQIRGGKNPSPSAAYRVKQEEAVVSRKNLIEMKSRLAEFSIVWLPLLLECVMLLKVPTCIKAESYSVTYITRIFLCYCTELECDQSNYS